MIDDRLRLFVAVPIGVELREALSAAVGGWRNDEAVAGLRWADPQGWHVTLAFLGATDASAVPALLERMAPVALEHGTMRASTGGLGAFPTPARARWIRGPPRRCSDSMRQELSATTCRPMRSARPISDRVP